MRAERKERASLYSEVTNRIIAELEEGRLPWVQPWDSAACGCTMPQNAGTARRYSGINVLLLTRSMQLAIVPGGQFDWTIVKRHAEKDDCIMTTTLTKRGKIVRSGGVLSFKIDGGTEAFSSSCGRQGNSQLGNSTERYDVQTSANRLILSSGSDKWTFTRN